MATKKQIEANQRNARKSTGPRTEAGKKRSSRNAMTHGFTARVHALDCESSADYRQLLDRYLELYPPSNEAEFEIVQQLTHSQWNLRQTRLIQKGLLDELYDEALEAEQDDLEWEETLAEEEGEEFEGKLDGSLDDHTRRLARCFRSGNRSLTRLTRYAAHFSAQWWRCYRALERSKRKNSVPTRQSGKLGSFPQSPHHSGSLSAAPPVPESGSTALETSVGCEAQYKQKDPPILRSAGPVSQPFRSHNPDEVPLKYGATTVRECLTPCR